MTNDKPIKLLYITCVANGGSTLTGRLFGHYDGFFNAGQIHGGLFVKKLFHGRLCGCGEQVENCKIWSRVFKIAFGGTDNTPVEQIVTYNKKINESTILNGMLSGGLHGKSPWKEYIPMLDSFYRAIQEVTQCRVIVDSSRIPGYAYLLSQVPSLQVYVAHIFRDPRGVIYSGIREARRAHGEEWSEIQYDLKAPLKSLSVLKHYMVTSWMSRHYPGRFVRFRYEDMIKNGETELKKAFDIMGEQQLGSPFIGPNTVDLTGDHTSGGNRMRLQTGVIELKEDLAWRTNLETRDRIITTTLTWPLLAYYRYL